MMFYDFPFSFSNPRLRPPWRHLRHAGRQAQSPVGPDLPPAEGGLFRLFSVGLSGPPLRLYQHHPQLRRSQPHLRPPADDRLRPVVSPLRLLFQRLHPDAGGHRPLLRALPRPGRRLGRLSAGHPQPCPLRPVRGADGRLSRRGLHLSLSVHRLRLLLRHFFGGPLRLPGQKGPVALAGRLSAPGLLHGHLSGLCDGGHRPVPAGHFPGDPGPVRLLLRHPAPGGAADAVPGCGGRPLLRHPAGLSSGEGPGAAVLSGDGCRQLRLSLLPPPRAAAGHLQAGGGFLLPARFRQHLHLRLDGRAGSGRAGAGRGLLPAVHGAGGALAGALAPPGRAGHAGPTPPGHQLRPDPQPLVRPHPPDEIRLCAGLSGGGAAG